MSSINHRLLLLEPDDFSQESISLLEKSGCQVLAGYPSDVPCKLSDIDILYSRLAYQLDSCFLSSFPSLKFIVSPATGVAHIDLDYLLRHNIKLISLQNQTKFLKTITPTVELNLWLILSLLRSSHLASYGLYHKNRAATWSRDNYIGCDLYGLSIGIIGLGRIGIHVATVLTALGGNVSYYDPYVSCDLYSKLDLTSLLSSSDVVSVNCIFNEATYGLITAKHLSYLKPNCVLVNTARGGIIEESSLLHSLNLNPSFKCGLDVLEFEHNKTSKCFEIQTELLKFSLANPGQLILTPHIGGASYSAMRKTENYCTHLLLNDPYFTTTSS